MWKLLSVCLSLQVKKGLLKIVGMNQVPIVWRDVDYNYLKVEADAQ